MQKSLELSAASFIAKWRASELKERSAAQEHFIDLCRLLGEPTPAEADPTGDRYCFERGARKDIGGEGWADVWKRHCFAWEYKGKHADLDAAFNQLRQYALALENPPLLIVSDMARFRIRTNWTNSVSETHEFALEDLADAGCRDKLKWAMSDPERLRPGESRQALTERAAAAFAALAERLRARDHAPQAVAHFVNRLVFCMFAEDVGLLPGNMFSRMLEAARRNPARFPDYASRLFAAMSEGGDIDFEAVAWFNGGLFDDDEALPLEREEIDAALKAAALDWSEIDPSILGTLFERGLDPDKRSQLGAHYTDRDKIMAIVEPVDRPAPAGRMGDGKGRAGGCSRARSGGPLLPRAEPRTRPRGAPPRRVPGAAQEPSPCWTRPAAPGTSSTWRCMRSRTSSTGCSSRRRRWGSSGGSRRSARRASGASRSTPMRPSSRASRSGSGRSSGCAATDSAFPSTPC